MTPLPYLIPAAKNESMLEMSARFFAHSKHEGQQRKYTFEPYINHPKNVVEIVRTVPHSQEMLAAAWLHDVQEDCGVDNTQIYNLFGPVVAMYVSMLTDVSKTSDGNRAVRKALDLDHLRTAHPDAKTIKLADVIDNSASILLHDKNFAKTYLPEKRRLLDEALIAGNRKLWCRADLICKRAGYPIFSASNCLK